MSNEGSRQMLWVTAFALSAGIVVIGNAATDVILGQRPLADGTLGSIDAPDVALLHILFTGLPFLALAARGDRRLPMWIAAIVLTLAFWVYFNWQIWRDSLTGFAGGANIGLGLIMMAAPFVILLLLKAMSVFLRAKAH